MQWHGEHSRRPHRGKALMIASALKYCRPPVQVTVHTPLEQLAAPILGTWQYASSPPAARRSASVISLPKRVKMRPCSQK